MENLNQTISRKKNTPAPQSKTSPGWKLEKIKRTCDRHGEYDAEVLTSFGGKKIYNVCPKCEEDEAAFEAERAEIEKTRKIDDNLLRSGIPKRFKSCSFNEFARKSQQQKSVFKICKNYTDQIGSVKRNGVSLVLCGKPGTGKTHLACAILKQAILAGLDGKYASVYQLMSDYKRTFSRDSIETESEVLSKYLSPDLLVLDEVGVQFGTDTEKLIIFQTLNGRYNDIKPTILITNHSEGELSDYIGERCVDRMRENGGAVIAFDWESYRK